MQLSKIKLSGFKSFVDPITIPFPSQLIGIVGPNGCGKSNIIDAVRWVMGEGSAKTLRGDSMADVIFNGSSSRKPVGHASVELVFDNSDGMVGGQYAQYAEISIKRVVSRDGTSNYFLNNTRCRRKDITDIFHGTGLGPRSYSIIEQGMISRLIEARPEELRAFLEEAAGISRYKERRRETENRIRHARENIERLDDLRGEIENQLAHLKRQSRAAERYKELKEEERRVRAEVLALRWRTLEREAVAQRRSIAAEETRVEAAVAEQRSTEREIEQARTRHAEAIGAFNDVQGRFYGVGGDIARVEQDIQHSRELRQSREEDIKQLERTVAELREHLERDRAKAADDARFLAGLEPELSRLREAERASAEALSQAEQAMQDWQHRWEAFTGKAGEPARDAEVERTHLDHLEREQDEQAARVQRLAEELERISPEAVEREFESLEDRLRELDDSVRGAERALDGTKATLAGLRDRDTALSSELDGARNALQQASGRLASLETLQQAALGQSDGPVVRWLEGQGIADRPRLGETLHVEPGWERAVETVLGDWLQAVCVDEVDAVTGALGDLAGGSLTLYAGLDADSQRTMVSFAELEPLASKVTSDRPLSELLQAVYAVPTLADALALRDRLDPESSLITPEGVWLGQGWIRVVREIDAQAGVLTRAEEIRTLEHEREEAAARVSTLEKRYKALRAEIQDCEYARDEAQRELNQVHREHADTAASLKSRREREDQLEQRRETLSREIVSLREQSAARDARIREARQRLERAVDSMSGFERERETLDGERKSLRAALETAREKANRDREAIHALALQGESRRSASESLAANIERMEAQVAQHESRRQELTTSLEETRSPVERRQEELDALLGKRDGVERELKSARGLVEECEAHLRDLEQRRVAHEKKVGELREALQEARMNGQELKVRQQALNEQLAESGLTLETLFERLPEDAEVAEWEEKLGKLDARINRLGPINLAAIDEYSEQSQRKEYLDAQHADLTEALSTLDNAIRKIDRETRARFKDTFDRVNGGLQETFPKLFGGGHAYLELTGEDLLDTGVTVMARPPGKRNSNIHLLSGGEKALTAVALVFAIFDLNPAPFCMLDEVDAPLDDANVARFCELVREMSSRVQFVMITHNKLTMELAHQLTGVTMQEAGVSRLVAVDIDEAVHMAAS